jgi:hypothetical protein
MKLELIKMNLCEIRAYKNGFYEIRAYKNGFI